MFTRLSSHGSLLLFQDIATLEKLVQDDIDSGKVPVLLVAYAGG